MILAVSKNNHDASYCILDEKGKIIYYTQEERFSRKKHSSIFDNSLIDHINKNIDKFKIKEIKKLLISNSLRLSGEPLSMIDFVNKLNTHVEVGKLDNKNHHANHAFCGYSFSPFSNAICLVIDGWGSKIKIDNFSAYETTSIFEILKGKIKTIYKKINYDTHRFQIINKDFIKSKVDYDLDITHRLDIGVMYGTVSRHLGFTSLDAGKTMGLASWGKKDKKIPNMLIDKKNCNMNLFKNDRQLDTDLFPQLKNMSFTNKKNLAYAVQKSTEDYFVECMKYIKKKSKIKNIILSGGCALNVCANSVLKERYPEYNIFVDPIASDAGQSIGHAKLEHCEKKEIYKEKHVYLNTPYDKDTIIEELKKNEIDS